MNKEVKEFEKLLKLVNPERLDEYGLMIFKGINILLDYINQLETNIEEALKTTKELYKEGVEWHWDNGSLETYVLDLLSILERGKE